MGELGGREPVDPGAGEIVRYRLADRVAVLTLDRPPVNAFSTAMWKALAGALARAGADQTVHAVILTAAGSRAFCAGADVKEAAGLSPAEEQVRRRTVTNGLTALGTVPLPVVCAINAAAVGGGLNLATLCDYRIAADSASFRLPEIDHGRHAGGGAFLRRIGVAEGTLRAMLYTGRRLSAPEALAAGLVDEVVAADRLMPRAIELADAIAAKPRPALAAMKRAILAAEGRTGWLDGYRAADGSTGDAGGTPAGP